MWDKNIDFDKHNFNPFQCVKDCFEESELAPVIQVLRHRIGHSWVVVWWVVVAVVLVGRCTFEKRD